MSECVVQMEMPTKDRKCGMVFGFYGVWFCPVAKRVCDQPDLTGDIPSWCPILCSLPEGHGELIERQPIIQFIENGLNRGEYGHDQIEVMTEVFVAETIVPAEEERSET